MNEILSIVGTEVIGDEDSVVLLLPNDSTTLKFDQAINLAHAILSHIQQERKKRK